jgi:hypothetical protein
MARPDKLPVQVVSLLRYNVVETSLEGMHRLIVLGARDPLPDAHPCAITTLPK